jgi:hypothetical protein
VAHGLYSYFNDGIPAIISIRVTIALFGFSCNGFFVLHFAFVYLLAKYVHDGMVNKNSRNCEIKAWTTGFAFAFFAFFLFVFIPIAGLIFIAVGRI